MMIGGRNLGKPSDPAVRFIVALDGRTLETFEVAPSPGFFLRSLTLPEGALMGASARRGALGGDHREGRSATPRSWRRRLAAGDCSRSRRRWSSSICSRSTA